MKRSITLALAMALLTSLGPVAWAGGPKDDWQPSEKLKECYAQAAAKGTPVAVLVQIRNSNCPIHDGRVSTCENLQDLKGMVKIRIYSGEVPEGYQDLDRTGAASGLPLVNLTDGENHLLGYIADTTPVADVKEIAKQASAVMAWKATARSALASAEKQIEAKQLVPAWKQVDQIIKQDLAATKTVKMSVAKTAANYAASGESKPGASKKAVEVKEPEIAEGIFFSAKTKELMGKLEALLAEKLAEVEGLLGQGELQKAQRALAPLAQYKFGEARDAQIKALGEKIKVAIREAAKAKTDATKTDAQP
jgi:hypothetical protein